MLLVKSHNDLRFTSLLQGGETNIIQPSTTFLRWWSRWSTTSQHPSWRTWKHRCPAQSFVVDLFLGGWLFSEMVGAGGRWRMLKEGRWWNSLREILLMEEILHQLIGVRVIYIRMLQVWLRLICVRVRCCFFRRDFRRIACHPWRWSACWRRGGFPPVARVDGGNWFCSIEATTKWHATLICEESHPIRTS